REFFKTVVGRALRKKRYRLLITGRRRPPRKWPSVSNRFYRFLRRSTKTKCRDNPRQHYTSAFPTHGCTRSEVARSLGGYIEGALQRDSHGREGGLIKETSYQGYAVRDAPWG